MSSSTLDYLYGPLSQKYCMYFYALSVIGFLLLMSVVIFTVYSGLTAGKKLSYGFFMSMLMTAFVYGIFYFQNRLLYTMCAGTLKREGMDSDMSKGMNKLPEGMDKLLPKLKETMDKQKK